MSLIVDVLRAGDLLNCQIEFINLVVDNSPAPHLRRATAGDAFIVLRLPPQHIVEDALVSGELRAPPYASFLASPSRVAFLLPSGDISIDFNLRSVLQKITECTLARAETPPDSKAGTYVEFPDRLLLVPDERARLGHRSAPLISIDDGSKSAELWHTRFVLSAPSDAGGLRFRAVANPVDQSERALNAPLRLQDRRDVETRCDIAKQTTGNANVVASPQFILSAFGATARLHSTWPPDNQTQLAGWDHDSAHGRDRYVRTVRNGFLFPFGHQVLLTTITQREISMFSENSSVFGASGNFALLRQHTELVLQEPDRDYNDREMPFQHVQVTSLDHIPGLAGPHEVYSASMIATDSVGHIVKFNARVLSVLMDDAPDAAMLDQYASVQDPIELNYEPIVIARDVPSAANQSTSDASANIATMTFGVRVLQPGEVSIPSLPRFLPIMKEAELSIPALERLQGSVSTQSAATRARIRIKLSDQYKTSGFTGPNAKQQVFAAFVSDAVNIAIPAQRAGGLASPQFNGINGLSRTLGPLMGANTAGLPAPTGIDPTALVGEAKLLGTIALKDLIDTAQASAIDFLATEPEKLFDKIDNDTNFFLARPVMTTVRTKQGSVETITTRFGWKPKIKADGLPPLIKTTGEMVLKIRGSVSATIGGANDSTTCDVTGTLAPFGLSLADLATVKFSSLEFHSAAGSKMAVKTAIDGIEFKGALTFAEALKALIPIQGLDGASIKPQDDGVIVSYTFVVATAAFGVLTIQNIGFSSSISLPFLGNRPVAVRFALSERSKPFTVSVAPFGGTGFFAVEVRTDGTLQVEAVIEFGGIISINLLDIVRGGVYLLAGVYLSIQTSQSPNISAYIRVGGFVDVLGIVSISIDFYLGLHYVDNKLSGEAVLTIGVKVLFFNKHFSFTIHKEIAHLGDSPGRLTHAFVIRSAPVMNQQQWAAYCGAFA